MNTIQTLPGDIELRISGEPVPYREALAEMTERNAAIAAGEARELIWFLEHPPVYTAGTSAAVSDLLDPRFEVVEAGRGGRYTYHARASAWSMSCSICASARAMRAALSTRSKAG
ncbi:hypothetical protein MBENS4_2586 [Novosphingobium sp. MBES04]|nr:hypothetical protein MBENS4_2586 [Novosphingobium sp. MBES04]